MTVPSFCKTGILEQENNDIARNDVRCTQGHKLTAVCPRLGLTNQLHKAYSDHFRARTASGDEWSSPESHMVFPHATRRLLQSITDTRFIPEYLSQVPTQITTTRPLSFQRPSDTLLRILKHRIRAEVYFSVSAAPVAMLRLPRVRYSLCPWARCGKTFDRVHLYHLL